MILWRRVERNIDEGLAPWARRLLQGKAFGKNRGASSDNTLVPPCRNMHAQPLPESRLGAGPDGGRSSHEVSFRPYRLHHDFDCLPKIHPPFPLTWLPMKCSCVNRFTMPLHMGRLALISTIIFGGPMPLEMKGGENESGLNAPCSIILIAPDGDDAVDSRIARLQERLRVGGPHPVLVERLGWLFVATGRMSGDPGFYKLAESAADCLEARQSGSQGTALLRGHVLHNLHRFKEAEEAGRRLAAEQPRLPAAWGLLGDALMEQGKIDEATEAYQQMLDLAPNLQSLSRGAHIRWLTGDVAGALELMTQAVRAGSRREPDAVAWAYVRLAEYAIQEEKWEVARHSLQIAQEFQGNYSFAHLVEARLALATDDPPAAAEAASKAAAATPLPEYQWVLIESLIATGRKEEARAVERSLQRSGAANDPRSYSLYLSGGSGSSQEKQLALDLAREEIKTRQDIFSHDALAWSLYATGNPTEAKAHIDVALAEGTRHGRLFLHAGIIHAALNDRVEASHWLEKAQALQHMLLPSERGALGNARRRLLETAAAE